MSMTRGASLVCVYSTLVVGGKVSWVTERKWIGG